MTPMECLELIRREPFVPMRVRLRDGKMYEIKKPNTSLVRLDAYMIGIGNWNGFPDHHEMVPWSEIEAIDDMTVPAAQREQKHAS